MVICPESLKDDLKKKERIKQIRRRRFFIALIGFFAFFFVFIPAIGYFIMFLEKISAYA